MKGRLPLLLLAVGLPLAACNEMGQQPRYDSAEPSTLFADGKSLQAPPEGTVAQDQPLLDAALGDRPAMSAALLKRGGDALLDVVENAGRPQQGAGMGLRRLRDGAALCVELLEELATAGAVVAHAAAVQILEQLSDALVEFSQREERLVA